jgi:hypothetical protein
VEPGHPDAAVKIYEVDDLRKAAKNAPDGFEWIAYDNAGESYEVEISTEEYLNGLDDGVLSLDEDNGRWLSERAKEHPEEVAEHLPEIEPYLTVEEASELPVGFLSAIGNIAREYPERALPLVPKLKDCFSICIDEGQGATESGYALGMIAKEYPNVAVDIIPRLSELLRVEDGRAKNNAMALLGDLADEYTDEVAEHVSRCSRGVYSEDERTRCNALVVTSRVAKEYPDEVFEEVDVDRVVELLNEELERTRENACWTLLRLGERVSDTLPELERVANEDSSERVREVAGAAVDNIGDEGISA